MSRAEFLDYLSRAVAEEWISVGEAQDLLAAYDAGTLDLMALPMPLPVALAPTTPEEGEEAWLALLVFGALALFLIGAPLVPTRLPPLAAAERLGVSEALKTEFGETVGRHATEVAKNRNILVWQQGMETSVRDHLLQQAQLGAGRPLTPSELATLDRKIREELGALARFAEEQSAKQIAGRPLSEGAIRSRSQLYAGTGQATYYQQAEAGAGAGVVVDYISRDAPTTCSPCLRAQNEGPYLPGDSASPYPGSVCLGRGRCYCRRVERYDPAAYERLAGRAA